MNKNKISEYIEFNDLSDEELKKIKGLELLNPYYKEKFIEKCSKITVPEKVHAYDDLIKAHEDEISHRKARDKDHGFSDSDLFNLSSLNLKIREKTPVIPIEVSDEQIKRAYRIVILL